MNLKRHKEFIRYCLGAPKIKRTHIYASTPKSFSIRCPKGKNHKIEWSEYEKHIWCYKCERDYFLPYGTSYTGIFSGPILFNVAEAMGCDFRRINLITDEIISSDKLDEAYNATWVNDKALWEYDSLYDAKFGIDLHIAQVNQKGNPWDGIDADEWLRELRCTD